VERKNEILRMRLDGMTYQQIGKTLGISRQRVQYLISPPPYIRKLVVDRANGRCEICGILVGRSGHIHHEGTTFEDYQDDDNLKLLCVSCHKRVHQALEMGMNYGDYESIWGKNNRRSGK